MRKNFQEEDPDKYRFNFEQGVDIQSKFVVVSQKTVYPSSLVRFTPQRNEADSNLQTDLKIKVCQRVKEVALENCRRHLLSDVCSSRSIFCDDSHSTATELDGALVPCQIKTAGSRGKSGLECSKLKMILRSGETEELPDVITEISPLSLIAKNDFKLLGELAVASAKFRLTCEKFCLENLEDLLATRSAGYVFRSLSDKPAFVRQVLSKFSENPNLRRWSEVSVQIIADLIPKSPDEESLVFLIDEVESILKSKKQIHFLRILGSLIDRISGANLNRTAQVINYHMGWLLDDDLGHLGIQALIRNRSARTVQKFKRLAFEGGVLNLFIRKNRKQLLFETLKSFGVQQTEFFARMRKELMNNTSNMRQIMKHEDSCWLFTAVLFHDASTLRNTLSKVKRRVVRVAEENSQLHTHRPWTIITRSIDLYLFAKCPEEVSSIFG